MVGREMSLPLVAERAIWSHQIAKTRAGVIIAIVITAPFNQLHHYIVKKNTIAHLLLLYIIYYILYILYSVISFMNVTLWALPPR